MSFITQGFGIGNRIITQGYHSRVPSTANPPYKATLAFQQNPKGALAFAQNPKGTLVFSQDE